MIHTKLQHYSNIHDIINHEKYFNAFGKKTPHTIEENAFYNYVFYTLLNLRSQL